MTATKLEYEEIMDDRPRKLALSDVEYRPAQDRYRCDACLHFFERHIDNYATCEIFRPADESSILPEYVCNFFTPDGTNFPLL